MKNVFHAVKEICNFPNTLFNLALGAITCSGEKPRTTNIDAIVIVHLENVMLIWNTKNKVFCCFFNVSRNVKRASNIVGCSGWNIANDWLVFAFAHAIYNLVQGSVAPRNKEIVIFSASLFCKNACVTRLCCWAFFNIAIFFAKA